MTDVLNLKELEKKAFKSVFEDGLWDMLIGIVLFFSMAAPILLSDLGFGDFWSAAVFLPVNLGFIWLLKFTKIHTTVPRLGMVRMGEKRRKKVRGLQTVLIFMLVLGLIMGLVVFSFNETLKLINWFFAAIICFVFMFSFTAAAVKFNVRRFQYYGILITMLVPVGEILFRKGLIKHHGIPLAFGTAAVIILVTGIYKFYTFLKHFPLLTEETDDK